MKNTAALDRSTANGDEIVCNGITFERQDNGGCECWDAVSPVEGLTKFALKNYGGNPNEESGFSGWRVVAGGPFTSAGGWTDRHSALAGGSAFIATYWLGQAHEKMAKAIADQAQLKEFLDGFKR